MARPLTDEEALARMVRASDALGVEPCESVAAQTAMTVARGVLVLMLTGLEEAEDPISLPEP